MTGQERRRRRPPKGERGEGWWAKKPGGEWWCVCGAHEQAADPGWEFTRHWIHSHGKGQ